MYLFVNYYKFRTQVLCFYYTTSYCINHSTTLSTSYAGQVGQGANLSKSSSYFIWLIITGLQMRTPLLCKLTDLCSKQISKSQTIHISVLNTSKYFCICLFFFKEEFAKNTQKINYSPKIDNRYTKSVIYVWDHNGCISNPLS